MRSGARSRCGRRFRSDLIAAIAGESVGGVRQAFERASRVDPPPTPDVLIGRVVHTLLPGERVARTLIAAAQGFIVQMAMFGDSGPETMGDGLRGLMAMDVQKIS